MCNFMGSIIKGTFQGESEMDRDIGLKCRVEIIVKRLCYNITEVKLEGAQI